MTSILQSTRRPDITVNASGRIDITARIARLLNLHPGDVIGISREGVEYYLYVRLAASAAVGRHEGACLPTSRRSRGGSFRTWSVRLASALREAAGPAALGSPLATLRLPCGEPRVINDKTYIPIIIRCAL